MSIIDYWSHPTSPPRDTQRTALKWLEKQTAKYIFLELPVGGGKSHIGMTYSRFLNQGKGQSFILTPQRILQSQYEETFPSDLLFSLYGKSNYECRSNSTTCDIGALIAPKCGTCPHAIAKNKAVSTPNVVLNYKLAMLHFAFLDHFQKRQLMVMDECHVLEQQLTEFDAIGITRAKATKLGVKWKKQEDIFEAHQWVVKSYLPVLENKFSDLETMCKPLVCKTNLNPDEVQLLRDLNKLEAHLAEVLELKYISEEDLEEYVLVHDNMAIKFKRLYAAKSFMSIMNPKAEKFLFMSSTIINHKALCRDLGIDPNESAFLSLDSEFPEDKRPVFYMPQMKMNAQWKSDDNIKQREHYLDYVHQILEMHKDDSGIIHTANFAIAEWLVRNLNTTHRVLHHNPDSGDDRSKVINAFTKNKKPSILISPSITEGLDLKDDISRFAIFAKIPFGFLGDQWIKARMALSTEWYQRQALIQLIQGCGRIVRSKDDWGNVYILDASWGYLYKQTSHTIPSWWRDSYRISA